jgi:HSP20 family protein
MQKEKKSFFERLTGVINSEEDDTDVHEEAHEERAPVDRERAGHDWIEQEDTEGQLTVDVYQNASDIIIQTMVAGGRPDELDISITREMVTIKGKRDAPRGIAQDDYFYKELYWGSFSRTIILPQEVETEEAEAVERYGLLTIRLPKIDKNRAQKLKIKSV